VDQLTIEQLTGPPVDAAANEALIKVLAQQLNCPRNRVDLVRGHSSRHKTVKLYGLTPEDVLNRLGKAWRVHGLCSSSHFS
jgi:uncharacterized protein